MALSDEHACKIYFLLEIPIKVRRASSSRSKIIVNNYNTSIQYSWTVVLYSIPRVDILLVILFISTSVYVAQKMPYSTIVMVKKQSSKSGIAHSQGNIA